jgi:hypothetical protein
MRDLHQALADITAIRGQMARGTEFHGYGPAALATTAMLALLTAAAQTRRERFFWLETFQCKGTREQKLPSPPAFHVGIIMMHIKGRLRLVGQSDPKRHNCRASPAEA